MSSGWGLPVDKSCPCAPLSGDYSVDSMTHIVRNPDAGSLKGVQVDKVCKTSKGCSGGHLHGRQAITMLVHMSAVLTGTTGILEF